MRNFEAVRIRIRTVRPADELGIFKSFQDACDVGLTFPRQPSEAIARNAATTNLVAQARLHELKEYLLCDNLLFWRKAVERMLGSVRQCGARFANHSIDISRDPIAVGWKRRPQP